MATTITTWNTAARATTLLEALGLKDVRMRFLFHLLYLLRR